MIIESTYINLRSVQIEDATFIFNLRSLDYKTKFLSKITGDVQTQRLWIKKYKTRESLGEEFYFIIESKDHNKLGLVRVYDFQDDSFSWGSWITIKNAPFYTAIASALQVYEFGFYRLNFKKSHFFVSKENDKVLSFHKKFGATIVKVTKDEYELTIDKERYIQTKQIYKRYL